MDGLSIIFCKKEKIRTYTEVQFKSEKEVEEYSYIYRKASDITNKVKGTPSIIINITKNSIVLTITAISVMLVSSICHETLLAGSTILYACILISFFITQTLMTKYATIVELEKIKKEIENFPYTENLKAEPLIKLLVDNKTYKAI